MGDDALLDAVRAEVIAYGFRRATMTSVARRAGISRATLYRRDVTLEALVRDALVADFTAAVEAALPDDGDGDGDGDGEGFTRDVVVRAAIRAVDAVSTEFTQALIAHDPELLLPYLVERVGRSQRSVLDALGAAIALAQADGSVRDAPPEVLAMGAMQALMPYVVSHRPLEQIAPRHVWLDEAAHLLDGYLAPREHPSGGRPASPEEGIA